MAWDVCLCDAFA
ncbi:hypothetical protein FLL65_17745 [Vibrio cholerae]|nr:hypothetical protein FLL65_17745 [Vibrio cholerae]